MNHLFGSLQIPHGFKVTLRRTLAHSLALLLGLALLQVASLAQELVPFADSPAPAISFSEAYIERLQSEVMDEDVVHSVVPDLEKSRLHIGAKLSLQGVDLADLDETTPISIDLGNFKFMGSLGDDPGYLIGDHTSRVDLTSFDPESGEDQVVGHVTFAWTEDFLTVSVEANAPADFTVAAPTYTTSEDSIEDTLSMSLGFANRLLEARTIYVSGDASISTKTLGSGDNAEDFDMWAVRITGKNDNTPPKLIVLTPYANLSTKAAEIDLSGTVKDEHELDSVLVELNENEELLEAQFADGKWSLAQVALKPGANLLRIRARDLDGNESMVTRVIHRLTPLLVNIAGSGSVTTGFTGTSYREVGLPITINARPDVGALFDGWSGSITSASPGLSFTFQEGMVLQANFIPNPFLALKGRFSGLIRGAEATPTGSFTLTLTGAGSFTGKLLYGGMTSNFIGSFGNDGTYQATIIRADQSALSISLRLNLSDPNGTIAGALNDSQSLSSVLADRDPFSTNAVCPQAGNYTALLPAPSDPALPQGDGYASISVAKNGLAIITGATGDGTPFSGSAPVSRTGQFPLYVALYSNHGFIAGQVSFRDIPSVSDLDGILTWQKQSRPADLLYPAGFNTPTALTGSIYKAVKNVRLLALTEAPANAIVTIGAPSGTILSKTVTLNASSRLVVTFPASDALKMSFIASSGLFSGSFIDPATKSLRQFRGALLQKQICGAGVFRNATSAGYVDIRATANP